MPSTELRRLEAADATIGGVLFTFPSGISKSASWKSETRIADTLEMAKDITKRVLAQLLEEGRSDDAERTNWVSVVAGVEKHVRDWNATLPAIVTH